MKPLSQFSVEHLHARLQGLAKNLFFSGGQLFLPDDVSQAFHEAHEEALKRGPIPKLEVELLIRPTDAAPTFHDKYVVRYSKRKCLEDLCAGIVYFGPAKIYATLPNAAQRDDELQRSWHLADTTLVIGGVSYPASNLILNQAIKKQGGGFIHYNSLFMSIEESPKLQRAFGAEGYVLIHDYKVFYDIIAEALRAKLGDGHCASGLICYYDERHPQDLKTVKDLVFSKNLAYKYQREVRIAVFEVPNPDEWLEVKVKWPSDLISPIRSF